MLQSSSALEQGSLNARTLQPMNQLVVLRKEFMDLTKDPLIAIVLNQLLYWSRRVHDYPSYIEEEKESEPRFHFGWIYKTSEELIDETLIGVDRSTMCRYLTFLCDKGWIMRRSNPHNKWDKVPQYRVNLRKLESDLFALGHHVPNEKNPIGQIAQSNEDFDQSSQEDAQSYTYTETTSKEYRQREAAPALIKKMMESWKTNMPYDRPSLSECRIHQMETLLRQEFHNDIEEWERFCVRVRDCPFLMGQGSRGWRIRLDWLLSPNNFQKVQEGQYDDYGCVDSLFQHPQSCRSARKHHRPKMERVVHENGSGPCASKWICGRKATFLK